MSAASTILMIRPASFGYNEETAGDNFFQVRTTKDPSVLQQQALAEFDEMVRLLREKDVDLTLIGDTEEPPKPDAIFPNNWLSTTPGGIVSVFPMFAASRRLEIRKDILQILETGYNITAVQDWSTFDKEGKFLEGTGSMVMDHDHKMIYACLSERTDISVLEQFASANGYQAIPFLATDKNGFPVYHTNVLMTIGEKFCVLCESAIEEEWELIAVRQLLESTGHDIIPITKEQMHGYAGNMLEVVNRKGEKILVLSRTAFNSLRKEQKNMLEAYATLLPIEVNTIEESGGGSVRCMMAEIFLEKK